MSDFNTTRFAIIADIHSNSDALRAVLADIADQGISNIVNLGDHLSGPMAARETADILMAHDICAIRGNHDRWLLEVDPADMGPVDAVAFDQLDSHHLDWLRAMPATRWLSPEVFACHGTPTCDNSYWLETVTPGGTVAPRSRQEVAEMAQGLNATLYLCGHSHLPRRVDLPGGSIVLNPGSVGCPAYSDDTPIPHVVQSGTSAACYALAERVDHGWSTAFRHVPYDPAGMIALAKAANHAHWEMRLATGWLS